MLEVQPRPEVKRNQQQYDNRVGGRYLGNHLHPSLVGSFSRKFP